MQRRDALRLLVTGAALPALTPEVFAFFRDAHPSQGYALRTFSARQNATVVTMTDLIIPATQTPGAKEARVNEFIDLILTEWANDDERTRFLAGVDGVDKQSNELFGKNFVEASPAQQTALLRSLDDAAMADRNRAAQNREVHNAEATDENIQRRYDRQLDGNFWTVFKGITLHGYYTSEIGFTQELKMQIIPGAQHGCSPIPPELGNA